MHRSVLPCIENFKWRLTRLFRGGQRSRLARPAPSGHRRGTLRRVARQLGLRDGEVGARLLRHGRLEGGQQQRDAVAVVCQSGAHDHVVAARRGGGTGGGDVYTADGMADVGLMSYSDDEESTAENSDKTYRVEYIGAEPLFTT